MGPHIGNKLRSQMQGMEEEGKERSGNAFRCFSLSHVRRNERQRELNRVDRENRVEH